MNTKPILREILLPWQMRWVDDTSRFKIGLWSRQTGKSFSTAAEAVADCAVQPKNSSDLWVVLSAGERQALEWMEKAKKWAKAFKLAVDGYDEVRGAADALISRAEIRFSNGSRILAIPANPDTARGYSANLILDEFAIHEKPFDIWAAIYPSITNPLTGEKKLRIVSTPKGRGNKFADLWEHNAEYSKHKVTIEDAVREGLFGPVPSAECLVPGATNAQSTKHQALSTPWRRLEELRQGVDDPDIWAQEYLCEFVDNSSVLLPYELIGKCESSQIRDDGQSPVYIGMDIGRSKDLTVIVIAARFGDVLSIVGVETLRNMPFADQLEVLLSKARSPRVRAVRIDATGLGAMLAEEATRKLGAKCQGVVFNQSSKGEMFGLLRRRFEERSIRVPVSRDLREDLHAVQRVVSTGGQVTYAAPRNADGHSDRAAALALCCLAAKDEGSGYCQPPDEDFDERYTRGF